MTRRHGRTPQTAPTLRNRRPAAIVRYASPAFWTQGELEAAHSSRSVLQESGFVGPASFGRHQTWTYQVPRSYGRPNPSGQPVYFESIDDIVSLLAGQGVAANPAALDLTPRRRLALHLAALGSAARYRRPRLRYRIEEWRRMLQADGPLEYRGTADRPRPRLDCHPDGRDRRIVGCARGMSAKGNIPTPTARALSRRYAEGVAEVRTIDLEEFNRAMAAAPPPTPDDQSLLRDGRRLDSKEKVVAWLVEIGHMTPEEAAEFEAEH